jgi:hypothetical protein
MGVRHPISPQGTDATVARWTLVQERASEATAEILLLFFFAILLVIRPLRSFVENIDCVDYSLLSLAQEEPTPLETPVPAIVPAILTVPTAPILASISKPSRPIVSVAPLKIIPSLEPRSTTTQKPLRTKPVVSLGTISLGSFQIAPQPLSSLPSSSSSKSLSESSSLFRSLFSSGSSPSDLSESSEPSAPSTPPVIQLPSPLNVQQLEEARQQRLVRLHQKAREHMREAQKLFKYLLQQVDLSASPSPASPTSPSSPYVPPHLRQDPNPLANPSARPLPSVAQTSIVKGCFYCHNKYVDEDGIYPPHRHRNKCPWFHHHLVVGTCHLNDFGELCLGPRIVGRSAAPLPFYNSKISQGEQVKARTDGTEYDEVLANRLRNPVVFRH